jgi:DNA polymerase I-like protein with 3'-5' exonuclease and polymerase domains
VTTLYLDIENVPAVTGEWQDLLLGGYAVDDGPVEQVRWRDFESDEANMFSEQAYRLLDLLQDSKVDKVSHSAHDVRWMMQAGSGIVGPYHDTMVMAWLINENTPLDLDWLADRYSNIDMDKRLKRSGGRVWFRYEPGGDETPRLIPLDEMQAAREEYDWKDVWRQFEEYNVRDVEALRELYLDMRERLEESGRWEHFVEEEAPYSAVLRRMEARGMPIDLRAVTVLAHEMTIEKDRTKEQLLADAGLPDSFNLGSQPQLVAYLFSRQFHLNDTVTLDEWEMGAYKSCVVGEHEDCEKHHVVDLAVPPGFTVDKVGRTTLHGHWSLKGRGLPPTPPTVDKVTGKTGKLPSTASPVLLYEVGTDDWVRQLCTGYRKYEKLLNTYLLKFPRIAVEVDDSNGRAGASPSRRSTSTRIYGRYNQTGTVTGRLSSSDPNMQNMPARGSLGKKVRALFVAQLLVGDYDQIEMRLMAHYSQDKRMVRIFRDGLDPHVETMHGIFGDVDPHGIAVGASIEYRDAAKQLNYAMGYGAGKKKVAQTLSLFGFPTTDEVAGGYLAEMESFYKGYFRWKKTVINGAKRRGNVRTLGGRVRHLRSQFADTANWKLMSYGERQAVNTKIQGSAADIIRRGMVVADRDFPELGMLAQVHDEVVWEYYDLPDHETLGRLQRAMEEGHGYDLRVPLGFHPVVVDNWGQKGIGGADWWIAAEAEEE